MSSLTQPTEAMVETVARGEYFRMVDNADAISPVVWPKGTAPSWEALEPRKQEAIRDRARMWLRIALPLVTEAMVIERLRAIAEEKK